MRVHSECMCDAVPTLISVAFAYNFLYILRNIFSRFKCGCAQLTYNFHIRNRSRMRNWRCGRNITMCARALAAAGKTSFQAVI